MTLDETVAALVKRLAAELERSGVTPRRQRFQLPPEWDALGLHALQTVEKRVHTITTATPYRVLNADPRRWAFYVVVPPAAPIGITLVPDASLDFFIDLAATRLHFVHFREFGALVGGEWFVRDGTGATITILSLTNRV